ncbi:MAG: flagellar type III secretion system protein FlhB [Pseudomonadota bacterium]
MADEEEASEKPFEATPRKLEKARQKGDVPISQDLLTAAVFLGVLVTAAVAGLSSIRDAGSHLMALFDRPDRIAEAAFGGGQPFAAVLIIGIAWPMAVWFVLPIGFVFAMAIAQNALVFAPQRLKPKLSRISPISTAKQKFGRDGIFNFFKSFFKLAVYSVVLALVGIAWAENILMTPALPFGASMDLAVSITFAFMATSLAVMISIGGIDFLWQRAQHLRKQRMSLKELRDETKESEGDPHTKQERRQRGYDIATNRMLTDVPSADVVIVNPLHYAVALKWERGGRAAPVCVAKGTDEIAARIRETAIAAAVPIHRDPPTARALFATVDLGKEIPPEHYRAVAAAIRFADAIRDKARRGP